MSRKAELDEKLILLHPDSRGLLEWLAPQLDDGMLHEIADLDYGGNDEHFAALVQIREKLDISAPLEWEPKEVLELERWSDPSEMRGHLKRAFCCTVLLLAATDPQNDGYFLSENETLIQLVRSAMALGRESCERVVPFLVWRLLREPYDTDEHPFFAVALLLLRVHLYRQGDWVGDLPWLCTWAVEEEARVRKEDYGADGDAWLLGLQFHDLRHDAWRQSARDLLVNPMPSMPEEVATVVSEIGRLMAGENTSSS